MPRKHERLSCESLESRRVLTGIGFESHIVDSVDALGPKTLESADLDGDGQLDLLVGSSWDSDVSWYKNEGNGEFGLHRSIARGDLAHAMDVDGDGDLDIIAADIRTAADGDLLWFENKDGRGNFEQRQLIHDGELWQTFQLTSADVDSDGDQDIVLVNRRGISWYENLDGSGSFGTQQGIVVQTNAVNSATVADFDGDGDADIVAAIGRYGDDGVVWLENVGGEYGELTTISTEVIDPTEVTTADVDGDGDIDVLVSSRIDGKLVWHENTDGSGAFSSEKFITTELTTVFTLTAADFDNDGDQDIVAGQYGRDAIPRFGIVGVPDIVAWFENTDGSGTFGSAQVITTEADGTTALFAADLDGDGDQDVASASFDDNKIAWHENADGKGTFGLQRLIGRAGETAQKVSAVDMDNDGDKDLLTATYKNSQFGWYENTDGRGTFSQQQHVIDTIVTPVSAFSALAADVDGDGDADVLADTGNFYSGSLALYENLGGGNFEEPEYIATDGVAGSFVGDIDGDGDPDVLFVRNKSIVWMENTDGAGTFGPTRTIADDDYIGRDVRLADLDGDGDNDLLSGFDWFENLNGLGDFGSRTAVTTEINTIGSAVPSDVDGDGDQDIVSALTNADMVVWFENDGQAGFGPMKTIANVDSPSSAEAMDIDGDGDQDVVTTSHGNHLTWYENKDGLGTFGTAITIATDGAYTQSLAADIDDDGDQDVVAFAARFGVGWYENRLIGDSNNDGVFNSGDLVAVFQAAEYEDGVYKNSTFREGDWNGDGEFDSGDLVLAFKSGTYVHAAKTRTDLGNARVDTVFARLGARVSFDKLKDDIAFQDVDDELYQSLQ